jgi:cell division protein FtsB
VDTDLMIWLWDKGLGWLVVSVLFTIGFVTWNIRPMKKDIHSINEDIQVLRKEAKEDMERLKAQSAKNHDQTIQRFDKMIFHLVAHKESN